MSFNPRRADPVELFMPEKPHFFKVILTNAITEGKLGIPKVFTRKYGSNLPHQVTLKVLPDSVWKMGLTRSDGVVWLQNGWKEFIEYYSIVHGHFLVFKYEKNSHFSVTIFNKTATEIDYPYDLIHDDKESETEEIDDSLSAEISDNIVQSSRRRQKSQLSNPRPHKIIRTHSTTQSNKRRKPQAGNLNKLMLQETPGPRELADKFTPEYPFFKITFGPSHQINVTQPWKFAKKLSKQTVEKEVTRVHLRVGEKSWPVKFHSYPEHKQGKSGSGWKVFVSENSLQTGDVCVFELINKDDAIVKVSIFKNVG